MRLKLLCCIVVGMLTLPVSAFAVDEAWIGQRKLMVDKQVMPYKKELQALQSKLSTKPISAKDIAAFRKLINKPFDKARREQVKPMPPVMIFISFSMPIQSLKQWNVQAQQIGAPLIIRGLVNNSFKATTKKVSQLLVNDKGGVQLDPVKFEQYHILQVPAVVIVGEDKKDFDVVYGNVPLKQALEYLSEHAGKTKAQAKALLTKLKRSWQVVSSDDAA